MKKKNHSENSKLTLGLALLVMGIILLSNIFQPKKVESSSFESEPVKISGFSENASDESQFPQRILIPEIQTDLNVQSAKLVNGYWEVFNDKAGWGEGTGVPGKNGNQVIFAHARDGLFGNLKYSEIGMKIYVFSKENWYSYEITEIKEVTPDQTEVIEPSDNEMLTLYTCSGFADSKRLIVMAKRI